MNETVKQQCQAKPMTVTAHNSIVFNDQLNANNCAFSSRLGSLTHGSGLFRVLSSASAPVPAPVPSASVLSASVLSASVPSASVPSAPVRSIGHSNSNHTEHPSSVILRQKLLHRKNGPNAGSSTGSTRSYKKSNNGFKFHNFVINQEESACLEEQHGTKKISVSHWKRNSDDDFPIDVNSNLKTLDSDTINQHSDLINQQQSILETLLASTDEPKKLNKRKPSQVRRVLRPEINEHFDQMEPLDLSCKKIKIDTPLEKRERNCGTIKFKNKHIKQRESAESPSESIQHLIKSVNRSAAEASAIIASVRRPKNIQTVSGISSNHLLPNTSIHQHIEDPEPSPSPSPSSSLSKHQRQRHTQRSLIKKQLEDAFKQNGFLVKTKQVSDANNSAMFCKFRQLRKYTRYYLKSWHHHLPDEVNKLWKGFLPPKTIKPNSSHSQS